MSVNTELLNNGGVMGITNRDDTPIPPPAGFEEETPMQNQSTDQKDALQARIWEYQQSLKDTGGADISVEEVDDTILYINTLMQATPNDSDLISMLAETQQVKMTLSQMSEYEEPESQVAQPSPEMLSEPVITEVTEEERETLEEGVRELQVEEAARLAEEEPEELPAPPEEIHTEVQEAEEDVDPSAVEDVEIDTTIEKPTPTPVQDNPSYNTMQNAFVKAMEEKQAKEAKQSADMKTEAKPNSVMDKLNFTFNTNARAMQRADSNPEPPKPGTWGTANRTLYKFLKDFNKTGEIDGELLIAGHNLRVEKNMGLWEEGGSAGHEGFVILATDKDGRRIQPLIVHNNTSKINGKHALLPMAKGNFIIMGGWNHKIEILAIYQVDEMKYVPDPKHPKEEFPRFDSTLVACLSDAKFTVYEQDRCIFNIDSPVIDAALERMHDEEAKTAAYVRDYKYIACNYSDVRECTKDEAFVATMAHCPTLDEAYEEVSTILAKQMEKGYVKDVYPEMIVVQAYNPTAKRIGIYVMGMNYDAAKKTSAGARLIYRYAILAPGDTFYYPDKDPDQSITYEVLLEHLRRNNGSIATAFRRMTM